MVYYRIPKEDINQYSSFILTAQPLLLHCHLLRLKLYIYFRHRKTKPFTCHIALYIYDSISIRVPVCQSGTLHTHISHHHLSAVCVVV